MTPHVLKMVAMVNGVEAPGELRTKLLTPQLNAQPKAQTSPLVSNSLVIVMKLAPTHLEDWSLLKSVPWLFCQTTVESLNHVALAPKCKT